MGLNTFVDKENGHVFVVGDDLSVSCSKCFYTGSLVRFVDEEGYLRVRFADPDDIVICGDKNA